MKLLSLNLARFLPVLLIVVIAIEEGEASQTDVHVVGEAFGLKNAEFMYLETHCKRQHKMDGEVFYQRQDGSLIARKLLDFRSGKLTPSFVQHNIQANEKISISYDQTEVSMSVISNGKEQLDKKIPIAKGASLPIVIDAGFDTFIRDNWDKLDSGETRWFLFPLASRSRLISLRVRPATCSYETEADRCFKLEPSNWLFRMLAAPIELGYDASKVRLTRYRGLSNINDENGDGMVVDIRYSYEDKPGLACSVGTHSLTGSTINFNSAENNRS